MDESTLDRQHWETEWRALEDDLRTDPTAALPELDRLVTGMLEASGFDLTEPVIGDGEEGEVVSEYFAAHEIVEEAQIDPEHISAGDLAAAVVGYRAVVDHVVRTHEAAEAEEA